VTSEIGDKKSEYWGLCGWCGKKLLPSKRKVGFCYGCKQLYKKRAKEIREENKSLGKVIKMWKAADVYVRKAREELKTKVVYRDDLKNVYEFRRLREWRGRRSK